MMSVGGVGEVVPTTGHRTFTLRRNGDQQQQQQQQSTMLLRSGGINRSVCRNLFGAVAGGDENRCFVEEQLGRLRLEQNRRWNFDFENETPLPGFYDWEPTTTGNGVGCDANDDEKLRLRIGCDDAQPTPAPRQKQQTTLTAYFPQRKRVASNGSGVNCNGLNDGNDKDDGKQRRSHIIDGSKLSDTTCHMEATTTAAEPSLSVTVQQMSSNFATINAATAAKKAKP